MKKTVLTFGLISGAVASALLVATSALIGSAAYRTTDLLGYTSIVLSGLFVFFGIRSYREGAGGGRLSFGRGLVVGLLIALVSSLCYVAVFEVLYFEVMPDYGDRFTACMVERARESGASPAKLEETSQQAQHFKRLYDRPLTNAALSFVEVFPVGLVLAALSAAILRRRRVAAAEGGAR